jgi:hypothetical protein
MNAYLRDTTYTQAYILFAFGNASTQSFRYRTGLYNE